MHYSTRSFIGHPNDTSWSQYWENEPDDYSLKSTHGHLFGLISLHGEASSPNDLGREIIQQLDSNYFSSAFASPAQNLTSALQFIKDNYLANLSHLDLVVAVIIGDRIYLSSLNSGQVTFQRTSQISLLLNPTPQEISSISGTIVPGDRFVLSTQGFLDQYGWDQVKSFLSSSNIQEVEENFMSLLYSLEQQETISAAIVESHSDDPSVDTPIAITEPEVSVSPSSVKKSTFLSKLFTQKSIKVSLPSSAIANRRHKINILIAVVLIVAFSFSIYLSVSRNRSLQIENEYQSLKSQYQDKYNNALAIKAINLDESLSVANEASTFVNKMSSLNLHQDEVNSFKSQLQQLLTETGSSEAYQPDFLYDTANIGSSSTYNFSYLYKGDLYLLDSKKGQLDMVNVTNRNQKQIINNPDLIGATSIAVDNSIVYFLKGQKVLSLKDKTISTAIDLSDQVEGLASGQINFWNSSLYLLAQTNANPTIWKFAPSSASGFSKGSLWLKEKQLLPADSSSFAINGSIWVISKSGKIVSYTLGLEDKVSFTNKPNATEASNISISPDSETVTFFEKNMVYISRKTSNAISGYNFGDKNILSLSLDSASKTVFVLCSDQKIYKIGL